MTVAHFPVLTGVNVKELRYVDERHYRYDKPPTELDKSVPDRGSRSDRPRYHANTRWSADTAGLGRATPRRSPLSNPNP